MSRDPHALASRSPQGGADGRAVYLDLIRSLIAVGRNLGGFVDHPPAPGLLLRLDVDYDLELALVAAEANAELGVVATFFVQVSSPFYNVLSPTSRRALRGIAAAGQRLGLHERSPPQDGFDEEPLRWALDALSRAACTSCDAVVAWHNPPGDPTLHEASLARAGLSSAYAPEVFGRDRYVSDSNLRRSRAELVSFVAGTSSPLAQVLLHPVCWLAGAGSMTSVLVDILRRRVAASCEALDAENAVWAAELGRHVRSRVLDAPLWSELP